ncbi:beta strand repeat-containing protein [Leptothoe kymatousa]|uniref:S-layer family protein n=1 Tax=Leptothoe kymatousa TAU-MAC 1615 TaxID=2364775 RepID=A0ABS5Y0Y6_9CYAN|nr:S-layer family protein [Leptothoe kymatousa]MBT9311495.1 S-layer family protein [Leptothoe kymatousa TAU-MAC 1615]
MIANPGYAQTQVSGDGTVGTLVNGALSSACNTGVCSITGGTTVGNSLFHSFDQFSLQAGDQAQFENIGVDAIFSRVTGGISSIDGIISTTTTAPTDIFLLNPQGIIFGANASLNIGGSFLASTADTMVFDNGAAFSASNPTQLGGLLSISTPVGLQYGTNPGGIELQGPGHQMSLSPFFEFVRTNRPDGLRVNSGETLALLGGPVTLNGGNVTAFGGNVELASVGGNSVIGLQQNDWQFDYAQAANVQDITLGNASSVDVSAADGGSVNVRAGNLSLVDGSVIAANLQGPGTGGGITIETDSILVRDRSGDIKSGLYSDVEFPATGQGGDLTIQTQQLSVLNAGELSANTYWDGNTGNVYVQADTITMTGESFIVSFGDFAAFGNTGDVTVTANIIDLRDGAQIATTNLGAGATGVMRVNADQLFFQGSSADGITQSGLESIGRISDGGTILVDADTIQMLDGGLIAASTFGSAPGGDITISANSLNATGGTPNGGPSGVLSSVLPNGIGDGGNVLLMVDQISLADGANVGVNTFGDGNAGSLTINAQTIDLAGAAADGRTAILANAIEGSGNGGNIDITAQQVNIRDGATITVGNFQTVGNATPGQGAPGNITLVANGLSLNNDATIEADTIAANNNLGNIVLNLDTLTLQQGSRISTNAQGSSTGGNITIDATIALIAKDNSDISANAQQGAGGRIVVNASQIWGTEFRPQLTPDNDITASSDLGPSFGGTVELNTSYLEPTQGVATLPAATVDADQQVARQCSVDDANSLVVSGRGGVADDPTQSLRDNHVWADLRLPAPGLSQVSALPDSVTVAANQLAPSEGDRLVEAQALAMEDGQIQLVASTQRETSFSKAVICGAEA